MTWLKNIWNKASAIEKFIIVVIIALIMYILFTLLQKAFKKSSGQTAIDNAKDELADLLNKGETLSYSAAQFSTFADSLEQAMSGQGTDEEEIGRVFKYMQTKADVLQLIKTYGIRQYKDDKLFVWNVHDLNLNEWLTEELDADDKTQYINGPLKKKNIDYSF